MKSITRKNILSAAKNSIKQEILNSLHAVQRDIAAEMNKDVEERDTQLIDDLNAKASELIREHNSFGKSKKAKIKASIEWATDSNGNLIETPKKMSKKISDWDAVHRIKDVHRKSMTPRASDWLQVGSLVTQRGSTLPVMVLSIRNTGLVEILAGGQTKVVRDISLRPAFDEE